jgi:cephalosporin-C deacetylase-like acetyl esterase
MRKSIILAFVAAIFATPVFAATYKVEADKKDGIYRCGEKATFTVTILDTKNLLKSDLKQDVQLDNFGTQLVAKSSFDMVKGAKFSISGTLNQPGFLRLTLPQTKSPPHADVRIHSVAFEPEKISKGSPSPADFDEFWTEAQKKIAREVPLDPRMELIAERSTGEFDFYHISFSTYARRIYGYFSVPKDKSKAPFPVRISVNAAGFGNWSNDMQGSPDAICAQFAVYDWPMDWKWQEKGLKSKYDELNAQCDAKYSCGLYCVAGITHSREEYFFYPVILGINRAIDWIATSFPVDAANFSYQGISQGGGFGFYLCALNHRFTRAAFYVPAITDTMGYLAGRESGWPKIVERNSSTPERRAAAERWAPYFDTANFASRIKCSVRVAVGFSDDVCPPCAVYASYNEIKVKDKAILNGIGMTHDCFPSFCDELGRWATQVGICIQ